MKKELMELVGFEGTVLELSNKLQWLSYEDICNFGNLSEILEGDNIIVDVESFEEKYIQVFFEVTSLTDYEENILDTFVRITSVEDF